MSVENAVLNSSRPARLKTTFGTGRDTLAGLAANGKVKVDSVYETAGASVEGDGGGAKWKCTTVSATGKTEGFDSEGIYYVNAGSGSFAGFENVSNVVDVRQYTSSTIDQTDGLVLAAKTGRLIVKTEVLFDECVIDTAFECQGDGILKYIGSDGTASNNVNAMEITCNDSHISNLEFDFDNKAPNKGLLISGDHNRVTRLYHKNVESKLNTGTNQVFQTTGDDNTIDCLVQYNNLNTGNTNDSMPQGWVNNGDGNYVDNIFQVDCTSGILPNSASGVTKFGFAIQKNMDDNGVYALQGEVAGECVTYEGGEEAVVIKGYGHIGSVRVIGGTSNSALGIDNSENDFVIDSLVVTRDSSNASCQNIIKTRTANVTSGNVKIGKIIADLPSGTSLWNLSVGDVGRLVIGEADIDIDYDAAVFNPLSNFARMSACNSFDLGTIKIRIRDKNDVLTSSNRFQMTAPSTKLISASTLTSLQVAINNSTGRYKSDGQFRGALFANELITVGEVPWESTTGPYIREWSYSAAGVNGGLNATGGTWSAGNDYALTGATSAPFNKRVTVSGTVGTYSEGLTCTATGGVTVTLSGASSDLYAGRWVTINSVDSLIRKIDGTELVLNDNIPAGSGLAITYKNPTEVNY